MHNNVPITLSNHLDHDKRKTTTAGSKIPATDISWRHHSPARRKTGKNMCSLCANAHDVLATSVHYNVPHTSVIRGRGNNI